MMKVVWRRLRRSPYQAVVVILVTGLTFFVAAFLGLLGYASEAALSYFETRPQIIAFLSDEATPSEIASFQSRLSSDARVKEVKFVSKEEALAIYKQSTADNPLLSELVSPEIFPASVEFSVADLRFAEEVVAEIKGEEIVSQIGYTASVGGESLETVVGRLRQVTISIRQWGAGMLGFLILQSLLVLLVVMGIKIASRKDEIEILKLIGATPGYIRGPFVVEAILYVVMGVFMGWLVVVALALYGMPSLLAYFQNIPVLPQTLAELGVLLGIVLGGELVVAVFLGIVGSMMALWRYSRI